MKQHTEKIVATILCVFLGMAGIHRFYMRRWITGAMMLALAAACPTLASAWVTIDVLLILFGKLTKKQKSSKRNDVTPQVENSL